MLDLLRLREYGKGDGRSKLQIRYVVEDSIVLNVNKRHSLAGLKEESGHDVREPCDKKL